MSPNLVAFCQEIMTPLETLKALHEKASGAPIPWASASADREILDAKDTVIFTAHPGWHQQFDEEAHNVALVVAMRNALPDLLALAEAAQWLRNASKAIDAWIEDPGEGLGSHDRMMSLIQEHNKAAGETDTALSRLTTPRKADQ